MARPVEFDRQEVIQKSLMVFREKGYTATSMRDLEAVTGLNPGSFYAAFGNKHKFFIETLKHFYTFVQDSLKGMLESNHNPIEGIREFFTFSVSCVVSENKSERCCYVIKSALEMSIVDEQVNELVAAHFSKIESMLREALVLAQERSYVSANLDLDVVSKTLLNNLYGINIQSVVNPSFGDLDRMVENLFSSLLNTSKEQIGAVTH